MLNQLTDRDVLNFARAGCSPEEVGTYAGIPASHAEDWMNRVLVRFRSNVRELPRRGDARVELKVVA
jgi:hypothetical protein